LQRKGAKTQRAQSKNFSIVFSATFALEKQYKELLSLYRKFDLSRCEKITDKKVQDEIA